MSGKIEGVFRGFGRLAWKYGGKQATGIAIDALGTAAKPWLEKGTQWAGKQVRQTMIPYPEQMGNLAKGIDDFIAVKKKTYKTVEELQKTIRENGFATNAESLRTRFPDLGVEEADKLATVLNTDLREPFLADEEGGHLIFSDKQIQSLQEISATCKSYGTKTDQAVQRVFVSTLNQELNSKAPKVVKKARDALEKLLFPQKGLNAEQFKERLGKAILDLNALSPPPPNPPLLTKENVDKITDVIILFGDLLDDPTLTKLPKPNVGQVQEVYEIVSELHDSRQGLIRRTVDNLGQGMKDLGAQFQEMINGVLPADPNAPEDAEAEGGGTIATVLKKAKEWFDSLFVGVENAITHQAVRALSVVFEELLKFLKKHLKSANGLKEKEMKDAVDQCIHALQAARNHDSFGEIYNALETCFAVFSAPDKEVYLQNIRMPFNPANYTSAVPDLLKLAKAHEIKKETQKITPMMVEQKACRVKERSVFVLTTTAIKGLFGIAIDESEFTALLNPSPDIPPSAYPEIFRSQFFLFIDRSKTNIFVKWGAKCMYHIVHGFGCLFVHSAIDKIRRDFDEWRKKDIREKGKGVLQLGRHIFSVISGAYTSVSRTDPKHEKDFFVLLADEVKDPLRNAGLPPEKFYLSLVKTALKFVRLNWTKQIGDYFDELPFSSGAPAFMQTILDGLNTFCKKVLQALVYIPQIIINFLLQKITGFVISRSIKLHTFIDEHLEKLQDPLTPTSFAIHVVIEKKLREITELVQARLNQPDLEIENTPGPDVQIEIVTLVKTVLQVLEQSRKHTVRDLRLYDKADRTLFEHVQREVLEQVLPQARLPLATTLWATLQEALSEESLLEMMYNIFDIADNVFERQEVITQQQFHAVDKGIADLGETLIHIILKKILDDKLDINNARQQAEISKFTAAFKQQIRDFVQTISALQKTIADPRVPEKARRENVLKINQAMHNFIYQEVEALGQAGINDYLHEGTKSQLNALATELKKKIAPISNKIEAMQELNAEIGLHETTANSFIGARNALRALEHMLRHPNEPLNNITRSAPLLQQHIAVLSKSTLYSPEELIKQYNRFKEGQVRLKATQQTTAHLQMVEAHWNGYIGLKEENRQENEERLSAAYRQLLRLIHLLPELTQRELLGAAFDIHRCTNPDILPDLKARFVNAKKKIRIQKETEIQEIFMGLGTVKESMELCLKDVEKSQTAIREKRALLLEKNQELAADFASLGAWEQELGEVTIININFLALMDWVQNTIHSLAVSETKKIMAETRDVMLLPFVYTCIINQVGVKFLEKYGKEYIETKR